MRLKIAFWAFVVLTVALLGAYPVVVGVPPRNAPRKVLREFAVRNTIYFPALLVGFLGSAVTAILVVRQTKLEYARESAENLRALIEGTLNDHRKKSEDDPATG